MELNGNQFEQLEQALIEAYPDETKLKRMFWIAFSKKLQTVAEGANHTERVDALIEWAEANGKVTDLIRGAHRRNPTNRKLKDFCESNSLDLLQDACQENSSQITLEFLNALIGIPLLTLPFQILLTSGRAVLPSGASDSSSDKDWEDFNHEQLSPVMRFYGFLKLTLAKFPQSQKLPTLLRFVREVYSSLPDNSPIEETLSEWIQRVETEYGITPQPSPAQQSTSQQTCTLEASLMVTVRLDSKQKQGNALRYRVGGYLYFDQITSSNSTRLKPRPPLQLNLPNAESQPSVVCPWQQVPEYTDQFLQVANSLLSHQLKQQLDYRAYKLTVEFFLPIDFMGADVDQWPISSRQEPVGKDYGVVVRFCDRIDDDVRYNEICLAWEALQDVLNTTSNDELLSQHFENPVDFQQYSSWRQLEVNLRERLGLKLCCGLPESSSEQKGLFEAILFGDIPIAVWTRDNEILERDSESGEVNTINISAALNLFLAKECFLSPVNLAEKLKHIRLQAWAEVSETLQGRCLGDQMSLMLDNPERSPLLSQFSS